MSKSQYIKCLAYFQKHTTSKKILLTCASVLPLIIFISYPLFLISIYQTDFIYLAIILPASAFITNTLIRKHINAPRPFEVYDFEPLKSHDKGESFPSRHSTSALIIALTIAYIYPLWGAILIAVSIMIGFTRILCGVHFVKDVIGGFSIALMFGLVFLFI